MRSLLKKSQVNGMTYLECTKYKLQADYYESILLECTYVEDNTVWFVQRSPYTFCPDLGSYKLDRKTNKLYWLNQGFSIWMGKLWIGKLIVLRTSK